jgi:hypothetical protein
MAVLFLFSLLFVASECRYATILYTTWHDNFHHTRPDGGACYQPQMAPYCSYGQYHLWGYPAFGWDKYFWVVNGQPNAALIDHHAQLLRDAKIDFISLGLFDDICCHLSCAEFSLLYQHRFHERYSGLDFKWRSCCLCEICGSVSGG